MTQLTSLSLHLGGARGKKAGLVLIKTGRDYI